MPSNSKLPISLQLVGITAVIVFSMCTITTIAFVEDFVHQWDIIDEMPKTWDAFYYPVFFSPGLYAALATASAVMFAALLFAKGSSVIKISVAYIVVLLLALAWRIYVRFPYGGLDGFRLAQTSIKVYFWVHVLYGVWLVGLADALLPYHFLKRLFRVQ